MRFAAGFLGCFLVVMGGPGAEAADPYFVTADLHQYFDLPNIYDGGNWDATHDFWLYRENCRVVGEPNPWLIAPYRVPQFWDGTQLTLEFGFTWFWYNARPECIGFDVADFIFEARIVRLDPSPQSESGPYPTHLIAGTGQGTITVSDATRADPELAYTFNPLSPVILPGELVKIEFRLFTGEDTLYCQCTRPRIQALRVVAPVVLPFIFENGFEEGHAAFWDALMP